MSGMRLEAIVLEGRFVRLEPFTGEMKGEVFDAIGGFDDDWAIMASNASGAAFDGWWAKALDELSKGARIPFAIRRLSDGLIVGTTSFMNIGARDRRVEIGSTFLHPAARAGLVNPNGKLTLLAYAFRQGAHRVEFMVDEINKRSQAAVLKLGAKRDGVLRRNVVTWTGRVRDTCVFSITDLDWPQVRPGLEARVGGTAETAITAAL
jgi:RimJ/RimL family protein N-acetyltransferase